MRLSEYFDDQTPPPKFTRENDAAALKEFFAKHSLEKIIAGHTRELPNFPGLPPIRLFQFPEHAKASL